MIIAYCLVCQAIIGQLSSGAIGGTRTLTPVKEQRPQRCASTNSATIASQDLGRIDQPPNLAK